MSNLSIYNYLNLLIDQQIKEIGRASNMLWISLGKIVTVKYSNGEELLKSTFSINIQCSWRMIGKPPKSILFASSDIYEPNSSTKWTEDFNWDIQGINLFDQKSNEWLVANNPVFVKGVDVRDLGDLFLLLSTGDILEVFVDNSTTKEAWRFFERNSSQNHFIMTGNGVVF